MNKNEKRRQTPNRHFFPDQPMIRRIFMGCTIIETSNAPNAIGPYSQAISAGSFLFVSGQLGLDPQTGELMAPDFELQARQALENIKQIVLAAGCRMNQVVSVDIYLSNLSNFSKLNDIYEEFFEEHRPARAVVEVSGLPKRAGVEIKCIAYKG
jgi:2-iminobutanoate/2-iminopropanoate deaminase